MKNCNLLSFLLFGLTMSAGFVIADVIFQEPIDWWHALFMGEFVAVGLYFYNRYSAKNNDDNR